MGTNGLSGHYCWIGGWGSVSKQTKKTFLSNKLRDAGLNIFSYEYCIANTRFNEDEIDRKTEICAGLPDADGDGATDSGVGTCQGDDGGPLICLIDNQPFQIGIMSIATGCGDNN